MPWLVRGRQGTHAEQYKQYKDKLDDLGENLKGAEVRNCCPFLYGC